MATGTEQTRFWTLLVLVAVGALAIRVGYIAFDRWDTIPQFDARYYHETANLLAEGEGLVDPAAYPDDVRPTAGHPPLYSFYLAAFSLVGLDTPNAHMLASAVLGAVTVLVAGLIGRRLGGDRLGLLSALAVAISPNVWRHDGMLMSETVAVFATALAVWTAYRYLDRPGPGALALVGVSIGAATLARSELILLAPLLVVPLVLTTPNRSVTERFRWLVSAALACSLVVAPWVIRNWIRLDRPMLSSQLEITLATANCESTYFGDRIGYWDFSCALQIMADPSVETQDEARVTAELGDAAFDYVGEHLNRVPAVMGARVGRTLTLYRPDQQVDLDVFDEGASRTVATLGLWSFRAVAIAAVAGAVVLRRRRVPVFPLVATVVTVLTTVALVYSTTRFRAPADFALAILAAAAIDGAWARIRARRALPVEDSWSPEVGPRPESQTSPGPQVGSGSSS